MFPQEANCWMELTKMNNKYMYTVSTKYIVLKVEYTQISRFKRLS